MVQVKYTHKNYQTDTATVELYGHLASSIGRNVLRWTSNVIHHHTTPTMIETTSNYDQEDNVATKGYYLPNVGSNITVTFNMDMDRMIGNSPFELFDANNNLVAISGSWSSATTFTIDPTSNLTCTDKLDYHRLRVIRRLRTFDDSTESDSYLHFMDSGKYIDFRVLCDTVATLLRV